MKTITNALARILLSIFGATSATADVQVTKFDCSGSQTTATFASNTAVNVGDVTSTCRVWIRTTSTTDTVGKVSFTGTPLTEVLVHITGANVFPTVTNDPSDTLFAVEWKGFAEGIDSLIVQKIHLAVAISGTVTGEVEANTVFVVRADGSISADYIRAFGFGLAPSDAAISLVRGNAVSSPVVALNGSILNIQSQSNLSSPEIVSFADIGFISATGAIEAPGTQPVTISAANIRSVVAQRVHANITATAANGSVEQVLTTQSGANSFRGSVIAAVLGSANLPEDAKAIDIGGDLEAAATAGAPVLKFQNLLRRLHINGVAKGKIQIGSPEQPDVVVERRIQAEDGFTGDIEIFGDMSETIIAGREKVSDSTADVVLGKNIKRIWIKGDLIGRANAAPRILGCNMASILARSGTIDELHIEGSIRFLEGAGSYSQFPFIYAEAIGDFTVGGDASMKLHQGRLTTSDMEVLQATSGLACTVGSLTVKGMLTGRHAVTWAVPTTASPAPNNLRVGGGPSREGAAGVYSGLLHVTPKANPSPIVSSSVRAAFRGGATGLIVIEPPVLTVEPALSGQFRDQVSFGLAGDEWSDFSASVAIFQSNQFLSVTRACGTPPVTTTLPPYRSAYDRAAFPGAAYAYDKVQTGGGAIGMMPYSLNVDESTPQIEYPQYNNPSRLPQLGELQFSSGQVIYGSELWFNGPVYTTLTDPAQSPVKLEYVLNYLGTVQTMEIAEANYKVVVQRGAGTAALPGSRRLVIHATPYFHLGAGLYRVSPATDPDRVSTLLCESPPSWFGTSPPPFESAVADFQFYFWVGADCDSTLGVDPNWGITCDQCINCQFADFNQDGGVDGGDVESFNQAWQAGESSADANYDGGVDGSDLPVFYKCWAGGGCT